MLPPAHAFPIPAPENLCLEGIPLFISKVAAGFPSPAADHLESTLDLNSYLIRHRAASFFFTVSGRSMEQAGILDGDKIAVDRSVSPRHGHIVLALIDNEFTVKRLYSQNGIVELHAENPDFAPIRLDEGQQLTVWGVVVGVVRRLPV